MTSPDRTPTGPAATGAQRDDRRGDAAGERLRPRRRGSRLARRSDLYAGNANPALARKIGRYLGRRRWATCEVFEFANENIFVKILDNVREHDVYLVQPTCSPVQKSIMELLIMIDAFKRASAGRITAVVPVLRVRSLGQEGPAARAHHRAPHRGHDQRRGRRPAAHDGPPPGPDPGLLQHPGRRADRGPPALATTSSRSDLDDLVVVTDLGFAKRARTFAELVDAPLAIVEKRRDGQRRPRRGAQRHRRGARASAPSSWTTRSTPRAR